MRFLQKKFSSTIYFLAIYFTVGKRRNIFNDTKFIIETKAMPKRVVKGGANTLYLLSNNLVKQVIPDYLAFIHVVTHFKTKNITQIADPLLYSFENGPTIVSSTEEEIFRYVLNSKPKIAKVIEDGNIFLIDESSGMKHQIPDEDTLKYHGFDVKNAEYWYRLDIKKYWRGLYLPAVQREVSLISESIGGCACSRSNSISQASVNESFFSGSSKEGKVAHQHKLNLQQSICVARRDHTNGYVSPQLLLSPKVKLVDETADDATMAKIGCMVLVRIRKHDETSLSKSISQQCPGVCSLVPHMEVPFDPQILTESSRITCSLLFKNNYLVETANAKVEPLLNLIRIMARRRLQECSERFQLAASNSESHLRGLLHSSHSRQNKPQPAAERLKVGGLIIWIGGGPQSKTHVEMPQISSPHLSFPASYSYKMLPIVGWLASKAIYPCRVGTTQCRNESFIEYPWDPHHSNQYYNKYMPYSMMGNNTHDFGCEHRMLMRSLAHILSLFNPGFVIIVNDDISVNVGLLSPGTSLRNYAHTYMAANNIAISQLFPSEFLVSKKGFMMGAAGIFMGRGVLDKLESYTLVGPQNASDPSRTKEQALALSMLRLASDVSKQGCPACVQFHGNVSRYHEYGSVATIAVRVVDICVNLLSGEGTCYHSDHALSRCLAHGTYSTFVEANCSTSVLSGVLNSEVRIGMCLKKDGRLCSLEQHLTCKTFKQI